MSVFEVDDSRLVTTYRFGNDTIEFGIVSSRAEPLTNSGGDGGVPEVRSYAVSGVQRAVLARE